MEIKHFDATLDIKSVTDEGTFSGYGSVFDVEDFGGDIVAPGAFKESLEAYRAKGRMPALLWQHDHRQPIGVWESITEDAHGLKMDGRLLVKDVTRAREAHALMKAGAISGLSIGYIPKRWEDDDTGRRTLKEVDLWETSIVTFPMNDDARVEAVKAINDIHTVRDLEHFLRDAGLSKSQALGVVSKARTVLRRESEEEASEKTIRQLINSLGGK